MEKGEVVEMRQKPLDVLLWRFDVGAVGRDIELGHIYRLVVGVAKKVKRKVEKTWEVVAFFDVLNVVVLNFEGLMLSVKIQLHADRVLTACSRWSKTSSQLSR